MYKPKTPFIITTNSSLIYNLHADGYHRGQPIIVNEVQISLGGMHKKELREEIAKLIIDKLNDHYADELRVIAESNPEDNRAALRRSGASDCSTAEISNKESK